MSYAIPEPCIDPSDQSSVAVWPVDCISADLAQDRKFYADHESCIDCGSCESACPNGAIFRADQLSPDGPRSPVSTPPGTGIRKRPAMPSAAGSRRRDVAYLSAPARRPAKSGAARPRLIAGAEALGPGIRNGPIGPIGIAAHG